jgi:hypothetical protein
MKVNTHRNVDELKVGDLWVGCGQSKVAVFVDITEDKVFVYDPVSQEVLTWTKEGLKGMLNPPPNWKSYYKDSYFSSPV